MKKSAIICKLFTVVIIAIAVLQLSACMKTVPTEKHSIPVPSDYPSAQDEYGADAFECSLDNSESGFYRINDYYNMEPTETLHIIDHFRTYQQTTEYTCGAASALMVLNYYGIDEYDEMLLAKLMKADETHGISVEGIWWPFVIWVIVAAAWGTIISRYYFKNVKYICPCAGAWGSPGLYCC